MAVGIIAHECKGPLAAGHGYSRRYHATRFSPDNVWTLCSGAHLFVDTHQAEKDFLWMTLIGAPLYASLRQTAILGMDRTDAIEEALDWLTGGEAA